MIDTCFAISLPRSLPSGSTSDVSSTCTAAALRADTADVLKHKPAPQVSLQIRRGAGTYCSAATHVARAARVARATLLGLSSGCVLVGGRAGAAAGAGAPCFVELRLACKQQDMLPIKH